jgi:hypothetical protein
MAEGDRGVDSGAAASGQISRPAAQAVNDLGYANRRDAFHEEGNVVGHYPHLVNRQFQRFGLPPQPLLPSSSHRLDQDRTSIFGAPHRVVLQTEYRSRVFAAPLATDISIRPTDN